MNEDVLKVLSSEQQAIPADELVVRRYRLEGLAFSSLHKFQNAEKSFNGADRVCATHEYPVCADVLSARGMMEMGRGNYAPAEVLFTRVLTVARSSKDLVWEADTLLNLSWAANEQTHYDEALDRADAARRIALAQDVADTAQKALGNLGWAYYKLGDLDRAEKIFVEAKNEAHKLEQIASEAGWWAALGYVHADTRNLDAAELNFEQSLALAKKAKSRGDVIDANIALAFVYERQGKLEDAKKNADEALAMSQADGNKRDQTYPRLVLGRIAARQHDSSTAQSAFRQVAASPDAPTFLKWQAEHSLARLYQDENHPADADREYKVALAMVESARSDVKKNEHRLPFLANATDIYDDYIHFLIGQGKLDQAIQAADFSRARTLSEGLGMISAGSAFSLAAFHAPQIARRAGGTILYYWLGEKQSYLWAITPQKMQLFPLPPGQEIEAAVGRYHDALTGGRPSAEDSNVDGELLYKILIAPASGLLAGEKNQHVFVIPDGQLNRLNFETLLSPGPTSHYWIEDVSISNASSLRMLSARSADSAKKIAPGSLLLVGDAIAPPHSDYPALPKAAAEMEMIQKHFGSAKQHVLAREDATPPAYLNSQPEKFSYIHFVAHGTASRQSPLDSAIVLTHATTDEDSFKLYARDIIRHKIHADLVTISTCYGSGTRAYSGEGLVGLSWAFLGAGAHNVIGALWEVSDASTPQLMDQLYGELKKGKSPDAALRAAKLTLLHSDSAFRKPYYWAPFQLYTGS